MTFPPPSATFQPSSSSPLKKIPRVTSAKITEVGALRACPSTEIVKKKIAKIESMLSELTKIVNYFQKSITC